MTRQSRMIRVCVMFEEGEELVPLRMKMEPIEELEVREDHLAAAVFLDCIVAVVGAAEK